NPTASIAAMKIVAVRNVQKRRRVSIPNRVGWASPRRVCPRLRAHPAVFLDLSRLHERRPVLLRDGLAVKREVQSEHAIEIGAAKIEAGAHHPDLVAHAHTAATGEKIGVFL